MKKMDEKICDNCNNEMMKCDTCDDYSNLHLMKQKSPKFPMICMYQDRLGDTKHPSIDSAKQHIKNIIEDELSIYVHNTEEDKENGEANETYVVDISSIEFIKKDN